VENCAVSVTHPAIPASVTHCASCGYNGSIWVDAWVPTTSPYTRFTNTGTTVQCSAAQTSTTSNTPASMDGKSITSQCANLVNWTTCSTYGTVSANWYVATYHEAAAVVQGRGYTSATAKTAMDNVCNQTSSCVGFANQAAGNATNWAECSDYTNNGDSRGIVKISKGVTTGLPTNGTSYTMSANCASSGYAIKMYICMWRP